MRDLLHKTGLGIALLTGLWSGSAGAQQTSRESAKEPALRERFDPARNAAQDIRNAIGEATRSRKRILLDVGGEWCIWCRRLDTLFATHKDIDDFLRRNYIVVKVNWSPENRNVSLLSKYPKIPGYPHFFVLRSNGSLLRSQDTGELEAGDHHDPARVLAFLKRWARGEDAGQSGVKQ